MVQDAITPLGYHYIRCFWRFVHDKAFPGPTNLSEFIKRLRCIARLTRHDLVEKLYGLDREGNPLNEFFEKLVENYKTLLETIFDKYPILKKSVNGKRTPFIRCLWRYIHILAFGDPEIDPLKQLAKFKCYRKVPKILRDIPNYLSSKSFYTVVDCYIKIIFAVFHENPELGDPGDIDWGGDDEYDGFGPCIIHQPPNPPDCDYIGRTIQGYCPTHYPL